MHHGSLQTHLGGWFHVFLWKKVFSLLWNNTEPDCDGAVEEVLVCTVLLSKTTGWTRAESGLVLLFSICITFCFWGLILSLSLSLSSSSFFFSSSLLLRNKVLSVTKSSWNTNTPAGSIHFQLNRPQLRGNSPCSDIPYHCNTSRGALSHWAFTLYTTILTVKTVRKL